MSVLSQAGPDGVSAEDLIEVGRFGDKDPISQLTREFRHLRSQGWTIENVAPTGAAARYRILKGDNRLRLALTPGQQAALQRAALLANRDDLVATLGLPDAARPADISTDTVVVSGGEAIETVARAVRRNCLLTFRYKGSARTAHPASLVHRNNTWYLTALEEGSTATKNYVLARMSEVAAGAAGSARPVESAQRLDLHPMRWLVDEPTQVTLRTPVRHVPDVRRWLGAPQAEEVDGDDAVLTYVVTHRAALRSRLYVLGTRVELVGPDDVREEMLEELREMAGV
ncbi:WYL domain-containing protein [Nocardioides sp. AE5]|uniref:WYL domain-containing protein n=1 Tax=Nocardioides sp. AE5 TaxID=2962573 RepID=UPI0028820442|nr:WYL domain-containing protein [Nocardioides sp. AE5]MDT0200927.1 WYL domain-containing protein [Nocardioides sp. AE5]